MQEEIFTRYGCRGTWIHLIGCKERYMGAGRDIHLIWVQRRDKERHYLQRRDIH